MNEDRRSLLSLVRRKQFFFWIKGHWEWGWVGNGWNVLRLGKVRIWL